MITEQMPSLGQIVDNISKGTQMLELLLSTLNKMSGQRRGGGKD